MVEMEQIIKCSRVVLISESDSVFDIVWFLLGVESIPPVFPGEFESGGQCMALNLFSILSLRGVHSVQWLS